MVLAQVRPVDRDDEVEPLRPWEGHGVQAVLQFEEAAKGLFGLEGGERLMALSSDLRQTPEADRVAVALVDE
jgi:hypothetical protein